MADAITQTRGTALQYPTWLILGGLVAVHALFNAILSPLGTTVSNVPEWQALTFMGVFCAQPLILSTWAGLGPGSIIHRLPLTLAALILLSFAEGSKKWNMLADPNEQYRLDLGGLVFGLTMFAIATIILLPLRRWARVEIARPKDWVAAQLSKSQFGMKYLLGWMTVSALLLGMGRLGARQLPSSPTVQDVGELSSFAGVTLLVVFPPIALSLWALSQPLRWRLIFIVFLLWIPGLWAAAETYVALAPRSSLQEAVFTFLFVQLGAAAAGVISAVAVRLAGYRLVRFARDGSLATAHTA